MGNCLRNPKTSFSSATNYHTESVASPPQEEADVDSDAEPMENIVSPNLKMYTLAELQSATRNFTRHENLDEKGGFQVGGVYKGWVDEATLAPSQLSIGIPVVVKKYQLDSDHSLKECKTEVKFLGKSSHSNVVKLLGYCWEDQQFFLVYEYMQKRSLDTILFRNGEQLSWQTRLQILIGAARGLAYLHTELNVIHRDFKTASVLLDGDFNAKVSDLGLAKPGPTNGYSHVCTDVVGTYGYAAPEYVATGNLYVNSVVYNFGVVLLEILTGRRVMDMNRPRNEDNLVDWARPYLHNKGKLKRIMDPKLEDRFPIKAAYKAAALVLKCLLHSPKDRPDMNEVLNTLEHIKTIPMSS
ncbi:putative serine/threonine-protein kinase NAK [Heracleum sosnowskyi]|uniref:Serine/threonine-protein kinase NAK n=1 Tax=Heracleum sosnowskyi TaxID=360622 RepID=A0AAD8IQI7_9APIA|nr:putative serine/threonine-protein kinase NAK [Heracleum sosnowskyi]